MQQLLVGINGFREKVEQIRRKYSGLATIEASILSRRGNSSLLRNQL